MTKDEILEELEKNIISDYFTANIKSEVILDMLLTPIIDKVLSIIGEKKKDKGIEGIVKLLAKEFPMLKEGQLDYRNRNADYLMCDDKSVYFVELKTTQGSFDDDQLEKYIEYLERYKEDKRFKDIAGKEFIKLLNHVSKTGHSKDNLEKLFEGVMHCNKPLEEKERLKWLFEKIICHPNAPEELKENWQNENRHAERAIIHLKDTQAISSKKYLLTAGQMLDSMKKDDKWWWDKRKIKLLYIMPEEEQISDLLEKKKKQLSEKKFKGTTSENLKKQIETYQKLLDLIDKKDVIFVTFQDIIKYCGEMEKSEKWEYWIWVKKILGECGLYATEKINSPHPPQK